MRLVIQRVSKASVTIAGEIKGQISQGLVILVGIQDQDTEKIAKFMAQKSVNLRIFQDAHNKMNLSALDIGAGILAISQFTLYADCKRGRRPSFVQAAPPEISKPLYDTFVAALRETGLTVAEGEFGAMMLVEINNDGPVTIFMDSEEISS